MKKKEAMKALHLSVHVKVFNTEVLIEDNVNGWRKKNQSIQKSRAGKVQKTGYHASPNTAELSW